MKDSYYPLRSLQEGHWFKLICGASYQHLPAIRNLALTYALAGADCIDVAADPAVIAAAQAGVAAAQAISAQTGLPPIQPWLMVSFNDGEDPHFRKAEFDPNHCPADCPRPCQQVCPAEAIVFADEIFADEIFTSKILADTITPAAIAPGVIADRCYGCGRCLPICPIQAITARSYVSTPAAVAPLILDAGIDAIEIHTQIGRFADFQRLWQAIAPWVSQLKLVAISCPDGAGPDAGSDGEGLIDYLRSLHTLISPLPCALIWQTDGRPMSGDIGTGATRAAIKLGQKVLAANLPGFVQLAGGTNAHTAEKLRSLGLLAPPSASAPLASASAAPHIAGIAYGSYARSLLNPILEQIATDNAASPCLEAVPELLWQGVALAHRLTAQLKSPRPTAQSRHACSLPAIAHLTSIS